MKPGADQVEPHGKDHSVEVRQGSCSMQLAQFLRSNERVDGFTIHSMYLDAGSFEDS